MPDAGDLLSCSFCGKTQKQVKKLIAGPSVYICDGCMRRSQAVMADPRRKRMQYRPFLLDGFLASTRLDLTPFR